MFVGVVVSFADSHYRSICIEYCENVMSLLLPLVTIIPLSVILLLSRDEVFRLWRKFALVWLPISIVMIAITPNATGTMQFIDKEFMALVFSFLFVTISILLIAYKSYQLRKR